MIPVGVQELYERTILERLRMKRMGWILTLAFEQPIGVSDILFVRSASIKHWHLLILLL